VLSIVLTRHNVRCLTSLHSVFVSVAASNRSVLLLCLLKVVLGADRARRYLLEVVAADNGVPALSATATVTVIFFLSSLCLRHILPSKQTSEWPITGPF